MKHDSDPPVPAVAPPRAPALLPAFARALAVLFLLQLRRALRQRSTLYAALCAALPVGLSALILWVAEEGGGEGPPLLPFTWFVMLRAVVPLAALLVGAGVVAEEVDDRTVTYLFVRPFPRPALLLGRWAACALVLSTLLALGVAVSLALLRRAELVELAGSTPAGLERRVLVATLLGGLVYSGLFAALGTLLKHPVLVGAGYVFAFEGLIGSLPGEVQGLTVQYYLKSYLVSGDEAARRLVELVPEAASAVDLVGPGEAVGTLLRVLGVALGLGAVVLARKQYVVPA